MKDLYIIGAGGFGREVAWLVERINAVVPVWNIKGFIDDNCSLKGTAQGAYKVVGNCKYLQEEANKAEVYAICAVGLAKARRKIVESLRESKVKMATLIDPSAQISAYVEIGEGSIICAGAVLTVNIMLGKHVIINLNCTVGHDVIVHDFVTVYPGVNISGNVEIGENSELGTGLEIIQGKNIGSGSIVGAGAVVVKDVPDQCTAVGNPARVIKYL